MKDCLFVAHNYMITSYYFLPFGKSSHTSKVPNAWYMSLGTIVEVDSRSQVFRPWTQNMENLGSGT